MGVAGLYTQLTPWELRGGVWCKRDDLYEYAGVRGGKVRTCRALATAAAAEGRTGLMTAGSRSSPQVNIVAHVGRELGLRVRAFVPSGKWLPEVQAAAAAGADIVAVRPGYNTVIKAAARREAEAHGWGHVPFGMECQEAVEAARHQTRKLPEDIRRLVVPVGSGMSLAGILWGLLERRPLLRVLGVCVGADPVKRLDRWAPALWRAQCELVDATEAYSSEAAVTQWCELELDPIYEAKCLPWLERGDGLWVVGIRQTAVARRPVEALA